jgi:7-carboxy-7-deazaguanine synthase
MTVSAEPITAPALPRIRPAAGDGSPLWQQARLMVHETYLSVQGESTFMGLPCVFVRLTGCPLRCTWCDTEYAFSGGQRMNAGEAVEAALSHGVRLVEVTGGEPLAQPGCMDLLRGLVLSGATVLLETSGALSIHQVPREVRVIMDLKCPGSGESHRNDWSNLEALLPTDEVKFVISDRADFLWASQQIRAHGLADRVGTILLSPVFGQCEPRELVEWLLADHTPGARIQLQVHKVIWPPHTRGV